MLKKITLANFKSFKSASLPLATLTVLVGANASGKSNLLEALRLLRGLARCSFVEDVFRACKGGDPVVRCRPSELFLDPSRPVALGVEGGDWSISGLISRSVLASHPINWSFWGKRSEMDNGMRCFTLRVSLPILVLM